MISDREKKHVPNCNMSGEGIFTICIQINFNVTSDEIKIRINVPAPPQYTLKGTSLH